MVKKVIKKKKPAAKKKVSTKMSFADLYMMYTFVSNDANKGFGMTAPEARKIVRAKQKELEAEMYKRIYGFNPFEKFSVEIEGERPENINLDRFAVKKNEEAEVEDERPQTFVVAKNPEGT